MGRWVERRRRPLVQQQNPAREPEQNDGSRPADQRWPWWPLLPLYPYGRRRTLVRELIPGQIWSFEQLQGIFYVAVPIRMTVARVRGGLMLYAPVAPTTELLRQLRDLEARFGPVRTIVLPTASGLEHKLPVPAMAMVMLPGCALMVANASLPERGSKAGPASQNAGDRPTRDTGVKSFTAS